MLEGFINGLFIAWVLTIFNIDDVILDAIEEIFNKKYSINVYYLIAGILGAISGFLGYSIWF
jgi:hypothetical protein